MPASLDTKHNSTYTSFGNVPSGTEALIVANLEAKTLLHVATSDREMSRFAESLRFFAPDIDVIEFPAWDTLPYDRASPNPIIVAKRIEALTKLCSKNFSEKKRTVIVSTVNAVLQKIPSPETFKSSSLILEKGKSGNREHVLKYLQNNGYDRVSKVVQQGEYAVRGSIIDLFPSGQEEAIRIDYFGEEIESIKTFDPLTQISAATLPKFLLLPASEIIFDINTVDKFKSNYRRIFGAVLKQDPLFEAISAGAKYPGMENWLPIFYDKVASLFDYLPKEIQVSFSHLTDEAIAEREEIVADYYDARKNSDYKPLPPESLYLSEQELHALPNTKIHFSPFLGGNSVDVGFRKIGKFNSDFEKVKELAANNKNKAVYISCYSQGSLEHIKTILKNHGIVAKQVANFPSNHQQQTINLFVLPLEEGFESEKFIIITEQDIFGDRFIRTVKKKKSAENLFAEASSLQVGELVVHETHGIGRFQGLETVTVNSLSHDMVRLVYEGGDRLFVPVENLDAISRYGSEDENTRLDKLGGIAWQERKSKLRERIKLAADTLLKIAAERALKTAPKFAPDSALYEEFCSKFPYAETEDQLRAISEVFEDLANGKPMDRLICGDVGFGKTEVAIRAAFAASSCGMQVAIICPTTLLARQHFKNFYERFNGLPIKVSQLSRMVSAESARQTKQGLEDGNVDIVIGTHALLSEEIKFKNLGLVIIDEEQHFGVAQKEKLKNLRAEVHVLALSATPIPRSLQMAMSGVRDLSLIATPPVDRLAVRTFVMPFDDLVIREAILRERNRGGRVYYVAPRITDLEELHTKLTKLVPEAKLKIAHGKLTPTELDKTMNQFFDGEFDVLLSTAIVESGLDISSANTLIVHRADMFGLSQLYQLRGRVGRGKIRAYAYFTTEVKKHMTDNALKRLEVIQTLDGLGAGFSVASHDMDIRGFGNLLGDEQSGHIKEVGVELYQKMLNEAIMRAKAEGANIASEPESFSPDINIGASILIPDFYIADLDLRMSLYKRGAGLKTVEDVDAFRIELIDRFGKPPQEVEHFLEVINLKILCRIAGIGKIDVGPKAIVVQFHKTTLVNPDKIMAFAMKNKNTVKLRPDNKLVFTKEESQDFESNIDNIKRVIGEIISL